MSVGDAWLLVGIVLLPLPLALYACAEAIWWGGRRAQLPASIATSTSPIAGN